MADHYIHFYWKLNLVSKKTWPHLPTAVFPSGLAATNIAKTGNDNNNKESDVENNEEVIEVDGGPMVHKVDGYIHRHGVVY